jgi:hypothetical protein
MAHKNHVHHNSSEAENHSNLGAKPETSVTSAGASSPSQKPSDESSSLTWQPIFVISAIVLGVLVLVAKVAGLF